MKHDSTGFEPESGILVQNKTGSGVHSIIPGTKTSVEAVRSAESIPSAFSLSSLYFCALRLSFYCAPHVSGSNHVHLGSAPCSTVESHKWLHAPMVTVDILKHSHKLRLLIQHNVCVNVYGMDYAILDMLRIRSQVGMAMDNVRRGIPPSLRKDSAVTKAHDSFNWGREKVSREVFSSVLSVACHRSLGVGFSVTSLLLLSFNIMGGDPVVTEPSVLKMEDDVKELHEKAGLLDFFQKFTGIARESLPTPWDRVVIQGMKYLTLEGKFRKLFGYHIAILNSIRNSVKINVPLFLLKSLEKSIKTVKSSKGQRPLHQDEKMGKEDVNQADSRKIRKDYEPLEEIKDSAKIPPNNQIVLKELKSHLKILNGLGGSLTGTCAYINLLTLEIANYLKEVVSRLKELNFWRS
eukprot:Gb_28164 [translate_table: standard]